MTTGKRVAYWDACVWLAYLRDEKSWPPAVLDGIAENVRDFDNDRLTILCSTIMRMEIVRTKGEDAHNKFLQLLQRRGLQEVDVDPRITKLATEIRQATPKLSVADCIHLATAVHYKAEVFYTLDGTGRGKANGLLSVEWPGIRIEEPSARQPSLLRFVGRDPELARTARRRPK